MSKHWLHGSISILLFALCGSVFAASTASNGKTAEFTSNFGSAALYAKAANLYRRMLPYRMFRNLAEKAHNEHINLDAYTVDPRKESWDIYVPVHYSPDNPPGVLVWVSDSDSGQPAPGWTQEFDAHNLIYISANQAGAHQDYIERRVALALHGLNGIAQNYKIDTSRIFVGGDKSGAAVANAIAVEYPDLFNGGVFVDGVPRLATAGTPVPSAQLLANVQKHKFYLALPGRDSKENAAEAYESAAERLCLAGLKVDKMPAGSASKALSEGLGYLDASESYAPTQSCLANLATQKQHRLAHVNSLFNDEEYEKAALEWQETYLAYGGLLPASIENLGSDIASHLASSQSHVLDGAFAQDAIFGPINNRPRPMPVFEHGRQINPGPAQIDHKVSLSARP